MLLCCFCAGQTETHSCVDTLSLRLLFIKHLATAPHNCCSQAGSLDWKQKSVHTDTSNPESILLKAFELRENQTRDRNLTSRRCLTQRQTSYACMVVWGFLVIFSITCTCGTVFHSLFSFHTLGFHSYLRDNKANAEATVGLIAFQISPTGSAMWRCCLPVNIWDSLHGRWHVLLIRH